MKDAKSTPYSTSINTESKPLKLLKKGKSNSKEKKSKQSEDPQDKQPAIEVKDVEMQVIEEEKAEDEFDASLLPKAKQENFDYDSIYSMDSQDFSDYSDFHDQKDHRADLTLNVVRKPACEITRVSAGTQTNNKKHLPKPQGLGARIF